MSKKKEIIILIIALGAITGFALPSPYNTVISMILLVPCVIYLIIDIIKKGNKWGD